MGLREALIILSEADEEDFHAGAKVLVDVLHNPAVMQLVAALQRLPTLAVMIRLFGIKFFVNAILIRQNPTLDPGELHCCHPFVFFRFSFFAGFTLGGLSSGWALAFA